MGLFVFLLFDELDNKREESNEENEEDGLDIEGGCGKEGDDKENK